MNVAGLQIEVVPCLFESLKHVLESRINCEVDKHIISLVKKYLGGV